MSELSIFPITTPQEAEACARLMSSSDPWVTLGRSLPACLQVFQDEKRERYIARLGGEFAGFLVLNLQGAFVGYIQSVCATPESRGTGVGSRLLRFAEERIFADHPNVFMCVSSFNTRARALYDRLGYQVVGELTDFIVTGHSEVLLRKTRGPLNGYRSGGAQHP